MSNTDFQPFRRARLLSFEAIRTEFFKMNTGIFIGIIILIFGCTWLLHLSSVSLVPPVDNLEQLIWVNAIQWGYYKHPPLPTWLIWLPTKIFGITAWTSYLLGAICTLGSATMLWKMLVNTRNRTYATVAFLAILCITYYGGRLNYYNHNTVLMVFVTASAVFCQKAFSTKKLRWWFAIGVTLGLGTLSKYQIAITALCVIAFWVQQRGWKSKNHIQGLFLSILVSCAIVMPHLFWLFQNDFGPLDYAIKSSSSMNDGFLQRGFESLNWLADQFLNRALPAWVFLSVIVWYSLRQKKSPFDALSVKESELLDTTRSLILIWGLLPFAFIAMYGLVTGAELPKQWGTAFLIFAVPAAMEITNKHIDWGKVNIKNAALFFLGMQILLMTFSYLTSPSGPSQTQTHHWQRFDATKLASLVEIPARNALGGKICVVSGDRSIAGSLAMKFSDHPKVLIDGRLDRSPWLTQELIDQCGLLEIAATALLPDGIPLTHEFSGYSWRVVTKINVSNGEIKKLILD